MIPGANKIRGSEEVRDYWRSKRFRGVWEQRMTKEPDFRYFACAENGARAKKERWG